MAISIQVRGQAARFFPEGKDSLMLPCPARISIADLLISLGVNAQLVIAVVNGQRVTADHTLADGDSILFFSPMAGG